MGGCQNTGHTTQIRLGLGVMWTGVSVPYVACTCSLGGLPASIVVTLLPAGYIYIALKGTTKKPLPQLKLGAVLSM